MKKILPIIACLCMLAGCSTPDRYIQISGYAQGGRYTVKLNLKGVSVAPETIRDSVEALLVRIDTSLSGYNQASLLSRFNAGETIRPNALFTDMYREAYRWYERSGGVLDFAAGPLYDAWGFGFREGSFPSEADVAVLRAESGMARLLPEMPVSADGTLNPAALLKAPGTLPRLNYNAIAQGYSCDLLARYLYSIGVKDMLVDIGEIWCDGVNPAGKPWSVGVDRPFDRPVDGTDQEGVDLDGIWSSGGNPSGLVTSGNYRKYYIRDGRKVAHTIDPRTGYPVEHNLLSATVFSSESAAAADAVATWCMVVGEDAAKALVLADPMLEAYLISSTEDEGMSEWASPGFRLLTSN